MSQMHDLLVPLLAPMTFSKAARRPHPWSKPLAATTTKPWMLAVLIGFSATVSAPANAQTVASPRPTPDQRLDRVLVPISSAIAELHLTSEEQQSINDLSYRAEALAAEQVESVQRGDTARANAAERSIAILARVLRGRIEALRAEAGATQSATRAAEQTQALRLARAALERATERRVIAEQLTQRAEQAAINDREQARATQNSQTAAANDGAEQPARPSPVSRRPRATTPANPPRRPAPTGGAH